MLAKCLEAQSIPVDTTIRELILIANQISWNEFLPCGWPSSESTSQPPPH